MHRVLAFAMALIVSACGANAPSVVRGTESPRPSVALNLRLSADSSVSSAEPPATPRPIPTPDPATRLAGGAFALPAVSPGTPFNGHLLIADAGNRRIVEIAPDGEMTWSFPAQGDTAASALGPWDDAHYAPDGRTIHANSAVTSTVVAISVAERAVKWRTGTPGRPARGADGFAGPDDAVAALDGTIWVADIRNCRVVHLSAEGTFLGALGSGACVHKPPMSFASPNAAYPTADGDLIVTEIGGSWIDRIGPDGTLRWSLHAPVIYPSDAVPYPDGSVLVTDYVSPGQVLRLAPDGTVLWRYDAVGQLHNPSSAVPIAANRVAISDDFGSRILIVDPTTNDIVRIYMSAGGVPLKLTDCVHFRPD